VESQSKTSEVTQESQQQQQQPESAQNVTQHGNFNFALATFVMENVYGTYHLGSGEGSQGSTPQSGSVHHKRIR
jgi:hypothetical protein